MHSYRELGIIKKLGYLGKEVCIFVHNFWTLFHLAFHYIYYQNGNTSTLLEKRERNSSDQIEPNIRKPCQMIQVKSCYLNISENTNKYVRS